MKRSLKTHSTGAPESVLLNKLSPALLACCSLESGEFKHSAAGLLLIHS